MQIEGVVVSSIFSDLEECVQTPRASRKAALLLKVVLRILIYAAPFVVCMWFFSRMCILGPPSPLELAGWVLLIAGILTLFVALSVFELWVMKKMGFDVLARLKVSGEHAKSRFMFEAIGVVAFVIIQPIVLCFLMRGLLKSIVAALCGT